MAKKTYTKISNWKIGFDPEYLLADKTGKIVNAIPVIKRDKYNPIILGKDMKCYWDCTNLEHTVPVSSSKKEMIENLRAVFKGIQTKVLGDKYRLISQAAHKFSNEELKPKESWEIGCSPSYNVWDMCVTENAPFPDTTRTTAGHVHVSHPSLTDFDNRNRMVKLLDIVVGNSLIVMGCDKTSVMRRKLYGKSGEFRFSETGDGRLEYRVPDSFYLRSPETTELVYDLIDYTFNLNGHGDKMIQSINIDEQRDAINNCKQNVSLSILKKIELSNPLLARVQKDYSYLKEDSMYSEWGI